jgi:hypothetical protein
MLKKLKDITTKGRHIILLDFLHKNNIIWRTNFSERFVEDFQLVSSEKVRFIEISDRKVISILARRIMTIKETSPLK